MAYAMYLRKSRADDELGYENTLERHEEMLGELAQRHNIHVDEQNIYREIVSGESIEARPQMQRLLKAVEAGMYTAVLCIELERLSRGNGSDQSRILRSFQFSDTKIITLNKTYDLASDDEFDEEFFEFGLFMSRREYKTIKRRLYRGRMQAQKEGYFIGSRTPLGYGKLSDKRPYTLTTRSTKGKKTTANGCCRNSTQSLQRSKPCWIGLAKHTRLGYTTEQRTSNVHRRSMPKRLI